MFQEVFAVMDIDATALMEALSSRNSSWLITEVLSVFTQSLLKIATASIPLRMGRSFLTQLTHSHLSITLPVLKSHTRHKSNRFVTKLQRVNLSRRTQHQVYPQA